MDDCVTWCTTTKQLHWWHQHTKCTSGDSTVWFLVHTKWTTTMWPLHLIANIFKMPDPICTFGRLLNAILFWTCLLNFTFINCFIQSSATWQNTTPFSACKTLPGGKHQWWRGHLNNMAECQTHHTSLNVTLMFLQSIFITFGLYSGSKKASESHF